MFDGAVGWNIATTRDENTETLNHDFFAFSKKVIMTEYRYQKKKLYSEFEYILLFIKLLIVACMQ